MKNLLRPLRHEWLQLVLLAVPFVLAAAWWSKLPAHVVTHWDIHNRPNGWMPKAPGLLLAPVLNVILCVVIAWLPRVDPRLRRGGSVTELGQRRAWRGCRLGYSAFMTAVSLAVIAAAAGWRMDIGRICFSGTFLLLAVLGNYLANLEPNYLLGIRTPWTLEDPATWRATHRLGSRVMVFGSVALFIVGFFVSSAVQVGLLIGFVVALAVWSLGYSAWFYQTHGAAAK